MQRRNLQPLYQEEAEEASEYLSERSALPSSESEGEDLIDNAEADYQPIPQLDVYENVGLDDQYYQVNPEERKAAEKQLRLKEKGEQYVEGFDQFLQEDSQYTQQRRKRHEFYQIYEEDEEQEIDFIDAEDMRGSFQEWFTNQATRRYIKRKLNKFITSYREDGHFVYFEKLKKMCLNNQQSLVVEYNHIKEFNTKLAEWLALYPTNVIPEYSAVVYTLASKIYPAYKDLISQCFFKVSGLPVADNIRTLSFNHLTQLIKVRGVITSAGMIYSQLRKIYYKCIRCGYVKGPFYPNQTVYIRLGACYSCHVRGSFIINSNRSVYRNYQRITIQQSPSSVAPGRIPRSKQAILLGDNIDKVKPGDEVDATGVYTTRYECVLNIKQGFPVFQTFIEINHIETVQKLNQQKKISDAQLQQFPKQANFERTFFNSIAPSIYGHVKVKKALTLALFGGVQKKNTKNYHRTRGDINVLLLGDPGIAKSQFLKSIQKIFPRCIYTTGKGASAVGLTAAVRQDSITGEWKLEAGALVLADKGVCLIDQFDKMSEQDRTSIHQAMQQQTISISKAGIVATLNARCSVIAAANPLGGIYNEGVSFKDNIDLSEPVLSRFDLLTVIKDRPDPQRDGKLASFVINQHMKNHPDRLQYEINHYENEEQEDKYEGQGQNGKKKKRMYLDEGEEEATLEQSADFIKQYIAYARQKYQPKLSQKSSIAIKQFYTKLREYSLTCGGLNIVVRHLESIIRLAEAHARMHLRKQTNDFDTKVAISTMLRSFIDTQRHSTAESIRKAFKYDLLVYD